jgi:hypothetical protein
MPGHQPFPQPFPLLAATAGTLKAITSASAAAVFFIVDIDISNGLQKGFTVTEEIWIE